MVLVHRMVSEAEQAECFARIRATAPVVMDAGALACLLDDMAWRPALRHENFIGAATVSATDGC